MDDFERWQQDVGPVEAQASTPTSNFDFFGILNRRKWWILLLLSVGLFAGFVYYQMTDPQYFSTARLTVSRRASLDRMGSNPINTQFISRQELQTQALTLGSPSTAYRAIKAFKLQEMCDVLRGLNDEQALQKIVNGISVSQGDAKYEDADVINLGYRGPNSKDCPKIINALISAYESDLKAGFKDTTNELREIYEKMIKGTQDQMRNLELQRQTLLKESPYLIDLQSSNVSMSSYSSARAQFDEAATNLERLTRRYKAAIQKLNGGEHRDVVLNWLIAEDPFLKDWYEATEAATLTGSYTTLAEMLMNLEPERDALLYKYGKNHPEVKKMEAKIKSVKDAYASKQASETPEQVAASLERAGIGIKGDLPILGEALTYDRLYHDTLAGGSTFETLYFDQRVLRPEGTAEEQRAPQADGLERRLRMLRLAIESATQASDVLMQKLTTEEARAKEIQTRASELRYLAQEIEDQRKRLQIADDKLREIDASPKDGFVVKTIMPPGLGTQVAPSLALNLVLGGSAGGLLGFILAFLLDRGDKSFRTPEEIRKTLGIPVVGHIPVFFPPEPDEIDPQLPPPSTAIAPQVCTYANPDSMAAEAYRGVRTNLYFSTHGESHKVIQITSPSAEDGKSTLAANLAVSLAQSGVRVLLVDADFRRPKVHQTFGIDKDNGLSNLIRGLIELPEAIHSTEIEGLEVMPSGPRPRNPSELLTLPRFKELLGTLRDRYDFVIIDSPPILAVTDPGAIAARADGVLLALQIRRKAKPAATRAVEILSELSANILGVVVNGVGWKRMYSYRDGGEFGKGSKFYRYSADFRGSYLMGDAYAYAPASLEPGTNGELVDATTREGTTVR